MQCNYCERRCKLEEGGSGLCGSYALEGGVVKELRPHRWSTLNIVHMESLPFYHAYPGSRTLMIGSSGCNFDCSYCSNAFIARETSSRHYLFQLEPGEVVRKARQAGCHNMVFALNEPTVSLQSFAELAEEARRAGLPVGCLTNGYQTQPAVELLSEICSFINVSLKSIGSCFYEEHAGIANIEPVLRNIKYLALRNHLEITTPVISSLNDHEIEGIAAFIYSINPQIPWHVFRLLPEYKMKERRHSSIEEISGRLEEARKLLPYIYFSNFVGSDWVSTLCPNCGTTAIERINLGGCGGKISEYRMQGNKCPVCGTVIPILGERVAWNENEAL